MTAMVVTAVVVPAVVLPTGVVMTLEVPVALVAVVPAVGEEAAGPGRTAGGGKSAGQQRGDGEKDDGKLAHGSITSQSPHSTKSTLVPRPPLRQSRAVLPPEEHGAGLAPPTEPSPQRGCGVHTSLSSLRLSSRTSERKRARSGIHGGAWRLASTWTPASSARVMEIGRASWRERVGQYV